MIKTIGVPKEIKSGEKRVGLRPQDVKELVETHGCSIFVESNAGLSCGYNNYEYQRAGAEVVNTADEVYNADLIIKVKEPLLDEYIYFSSNKIFFCYFHFAANNELRYNAEHSGVKCLPYEELQLSDGSLPLLKPMSEIAGKIGAQKGAELLAERGLLIGGATGVSPANVLVIGGGVVGYNAAKVAAGMGASVTILDKDLSRLEDLSHKLPTAQLKYYNKLSLSQSVMNSDLIIGAVHSRGKRTDCLINDSHFESMKKDSVFVDVAIDQGGCTSRSKPTTHSNPTYVYGNTTMYCVANMPALTAKTSTNALCNSSMKYITELLTTGNLDNYFKD